jgi:hypothetical protein
MDADDLYGLPLDQFVPARAALVKELRADGRRDEAAAASALRKPAVAAWAVNQLVRTQAREVSKLYEAGDAARDAQDAVVAGRSEPGALRASIAQERAAVDALVEKARGLLSSGGDPLSATVLERVAATLHAAALDDEARTLVADGRLERELRHVGLGVAAEPAPAAASPRAPAKKTAKTPASTAGKADTAARKADTAQAREAQRTQDAKDAKDAKEAQRAREARRERARERAAAQKAEARARRQAQAAEQTVRTAQDRLDRAEEALHHAQAELQKARTQAQAAADEHRAAQDTLDRVERA